MLKLVLPVAGLALGLGAGVGAGLLLAPSPAPAACAPGAAPGAPPAAEDHAGAAGHAAPETPETPEAPEADDAHGAPAAAEPCAEPAAEDAGDPSGEGGTGGDGHGEAATGGHDYVRLNNQFVVPVVAEGRVASLVLLSLSVEVPAGGEEAVLLAEPKLRDAFLQVLFDHANTGGFEGLFTATSAMRSLRGALLRAAREEMGGQVTDVLIVDLVRQDA